MPGRGTKAAGRGETINLRGSRKQKALIDHAAQTLGRSRSDFMLDTACRESEAVLLDRRYFALSEATFKRFTAMLDRPPKIMRDCGACFVLERRGSDERL